MKAVIMAGGRGTRIAAVRADIPKPMIPVCGKPILEWQIECLARQGITELILVIGHLGEAITDYLGDGSRFGVSIRYLTEREPLGTAGALYLLKDDLREDFLLLNGDLIFDVDISRLLARHREAGGLATILTHPNDHPYDSGLIEADEGGRVLRWLHKEDVRGDHKNRVNAGIHLLSPAILTRLRELKRTDLDREILRPLIEEGGLYVYDSPEYIKDMGTPARLHEVEEDIRRGIVARKNLKNKQRAVFFDRDGTLNRYIGFLRRPEELVLTSRAIEAVRRANRAGYLAILVTNQPVIARGEVTHEELSAIHNRLETLLGEGGAYLDDIFYCPHHPDKGFPGERPEYKIDCTCRKPRPGLLLAAAEKYNIDLRESYMVGDSESDRQAGLAAGCHVCLWERE